VAKTSKSAKLWKPYEDGSILFTFVALMASSANFIYSIVQSSKTDSSWGSVIRDGVIFLFNLGVFLLFLRQNHKLAVQMETKPIPVCFVTGRTAEEAQQGFEKLKNATGFTPWDKIEGFSTRSNCLMPWEKNRLPPDMNQWKRYIAEALQNVRNFVYAVQGTKVYHIAVHGPASLAIGLGAAFGTKYPLIFYHFQKDKYEPVLDLTQDPRLVKESLSPDYQPYYFETVHPDKYTPDIVVVLGSASHDDRAFVGARQYLEEQGKVWSIVEVHNTYGGNLKEKDWVPAVRELFSVFQNLSKQEGAKSFHVFYSMPVPLGFGLGMALGPFPDITLYNFETEQKTYFPVLKLNELGVTY
jgi:hypothetical protein